MNTLYDIAGGIFTLLFKLHTSFRTFLKFLVVIMLLATEDPRTSHCRLLSSHFITLTADIQYKHIGRDCQLFFIFFSYLVTKFSIEYTTPRHMYFKAFGEKSPLAIAFRLSPCPVALHDFPQTLFHLLDYTFVIPRHICLLADIVVHVI